MEKLLPSVSTELLPNPQPPSLLSKILHPPLAGRHTLDARLPLPMVMTRVVGPWWGVPNVPSQFLLNKYVTCSCGSSFPMSHVKFKEITRCMLLSFYSTCHRSLTPMSHVNFNKWIRCSVSFRGLRSYILLQQAMTRLMQGYHFPRSWGEKWGLDGGPKCHKLFFLN